MAPVGGWPLRCMCVFYISHSPQAFIIMILVQHFDGHTHYRRKNVCFNCIQTLYRVIFWSTCMQM